MAWIVIRRPCRFRFQYLSRFQGSRFQVPGPSLGVKSEVAVADEVKRWLRLRVAENWDLSVAVLL